MLSPEAFLEAVSALGIEFFAGVPDSVLKEFLLVLSCKIPAERHVICANEGGAIALAAGYYLASGKLPLVYMQNSGLGNAVNPLLSLCDSGVYGIPIFLLLGWRGQPGTSDEAHHQPMGAATLALLDCMKISYRVMDASSREISANVIEELGIRAIESRCPVALIFAKGSFAKAANKIEANISSNAELSREEAIEICLELLPKNTVLVASTGMTSRQLYESRNCRQESHSLDFLNPGAMGHASLISLGLALERPERRVACLDGDGALIMHMGSLVSIGKMHPANLMHIVFNNGVHDSVGGQETGALDIEIAKIAKSCGYSDARRCCSASELKKAIEHALVNKGPYLIEVLIKPGSKPGLGRPEANFEKQKLDFMQSF